MLSCITTCVMQDSFSFLVAMEIKVVVRVEIEVTNVHHLTMQFHSFVVTGPRVLEIRDSLMVKTKFSKGCSVPRQIIRVMTVK